MEQEIFWNLWKYLKINVGISYKISEPTGMTAKVTT